jgi:glucose/arabinose dehydrogenase
MRPQLKRKSARLSLESLEPRYAPAGLLSGFVEQTVAVGLNRPTAMALASDGRIFVAEQNGAVRIVEDGLVLPRPFLKLDTNMVSESGLIGITLDPQFPAQPYVYVQYTTSPFESSTFHNRVSRFRADGNLVVPGSEQVLIDLDTHTSSYHMAGALHFGADGKLYIATGDNAVKERAQSLNNTFGKVLRINPDGSIPTDNPFYTQTTGAKRAIWAYGLRNPYCFAVQPGTGRLFINDVGQNTWEEINEGRKGANYGWPVTEGPTTNASYVSPLYAYGHGSGGVDGACITGGAFYDPANAQFPDQYQGDYFFADYGSGNIYSLDTATGNVTTFATGTPWQTQPVGLAVDARGSLYCLTLGDGDATGGAIQRISVVNQRPVVQLSGNIAYRENAAPQPIAPTGAVTDVDSPHFSGGQLRVQITTNAEAADRLTIRSNGYVTLSGSTVLAGGVAIGTFSGGSGNNPLVIALNASATTARTSAVLRNIAYSNTSENPGTASRTISVVLAEADATTSVAKSLQVSVTAVNDAPVLASIGGTVGYKQNSASIAIAGSATVADADNSRFTGGKLTVAIVSGASASNRLELGGSFTLSGDQVLLNGVQIGTRNAGGGVGTTPLSITFNSAATTSVVQQLVRSLRFRTVSNTSLAQRSVQLTLTDGSGGTSNQPTRQVAISA